MREFFNAIRKHPLVATITAATLLSAVIKTLFDAVVGDALKDLVWKAIGRWLGISDVVWIVTILSVFIPVSVAGGLLWVAYRYGRYIESINAASATHQAGKTYDAKYANELHTFALAVLHMDRRPTAAYAGSMYRALQHFSNEAIGMHDLLALEKPIRNALYNYCAAVEVENAKDEHAARDAMETAARAACEATAWVKQVAQP